MIRVAILSRYQEQMTRGAERVVADLAKVLRSEFEVEILSGQAADSFKAVLAGKYDLVMPVNGRWQALKMSWGRIIGHYQVMIIGHSGLGRDDLWNLVVARPNIFVSLTAATLANWRMKLAKWLAPGVKVIQIPNGVDLTVFTGKGAKFSFDLPKPIILSVGALVEQKRHHLAIEAAAKLDFGSLVIVGDGQLKSELTRLAAKKLPGRYQIIQTDFVKMPEVYRGADLFTLPSWDREAFGLVYLEAMATGLGVVAPDDRSRREIIGTAGILVDVENSDKYATALKQALAKDWSSVSRYQVEKFSWSAVGAEYIKIIKKYVR